MKQTLSLEQALVTQIAAYVNLKNEKVVLEQSESHIRLELRGQVYREKFSAINPDERTINAMTRWGYARILDQLIPSELIQQQQENVVLNLVLDLIDNLDGRGVEDLREQVKRLRHPEPAQQQLLDIFKRQ